ncbi:hypothetical protein [Actinomycetospora sp. TBRC 11914]|uniref:hypothetical protein n=1 Tax=Actinomycetospora sp. TBRC 11914 TaxID=2729387 RepID=UPI00145F9784|nr:hypothetical protein [Actinomycetospora sp. TBRC 11914]NMO93935.1 hypothetical protein [Actinomycetospora sp. TBRC 11914]
MSVQLETQGDSARRTDRRHEMASLPAPRPVPDRPRPRWREDVGAAVLLSVLETLRDEDVTTSA